MDRAHRDLTLPGGKLTVAEVAARWQFADAGHLRRAYRAAYGHAPRRRPTPSP
ncbi:helix-turn-helix domain-containing protein [Streptomyces sp. NPDC058548]|uniref:helix-turn-helix domain-containing protein n=1 Tax=unclassified Streptomyces TaxID=2593676 RepID=UPI003666A8EF